ncbi:tetratricopeptide repeat protein [Gracilinema caldarium]|uniref:Tetratricopeptide repeat protein n=1 Tax=Gracilinema caldarium (strain ATCC 51460 / DSM 7334 / H1) TaxID=744872 RepID=F8EZ19_GRAC1|nr:tetratricopeptide repeat protein [Gracilinema caldarium]AEJ19250.1 hypothetical protein Spica_1103 [Gracilinema caldarium DSM 7334]
MVKSIQQEVQTLVHSSGGKIIRLGRETIAEFSEQSFTFSIQFFTFIQQLIPFCQKLRKLLLGYSIYFYTEDTFANDTCVKRLVHHKDSIGIFCSPELVTIFAPLFAVESLPDTNIFQLKDLKKIKELPLPDIDTLIPRFRTELDSSAARCKILLGKNRALLMLLNNTYIEQQYKDVLQFYISFNPAGPSLNGFIELFIQSIQERDEFSQPYKEKLALLKAERLHEQYNETIQSHLKELLNLWNSIYETIPLVLHIDYLDALHDTLQTICRQFLVAFLQSPIHRVHIFATDRKSLSWIDEIDRHFVFIQSPERSWNGLLDETDQYLNPRIIVPAAYLCHKLSSIYSKSELSLQLERSGFSKSSIQWLFEVFNKTGIFPVGAADFIISSGTESMLTNYLQEKDSHLVNSIVQERLRESVSKHELLPSMGLLVCYIGVEGNADPDFILDCIIHDLQNDYFVELDRSIQSERLIQLIGNELFPALYYILITDHLVTTGSPQDLLNAVHNTVPSTISNNRIKAFCHINAALLNLVSGDLGVASENIKTALLLLQDYKNKQGLEKVFRIFGLLKLAQHNIEDSIEYLTFALDSAQECANTCERAYSSYYISVAYFLQGNFPRAIFFINMAIQLFHNLDNQQWEEKSLFLLGRLQFSLGNYEKALEAFDLIHGVDIASLWRLRATLYASIGNTIAMKRIAESYATLHIQDPMLEIELHFFLGNYEACSRRCDAMLMSEPVSLLRVTEQVDWTDGYAQIESLLFPRRDFLYRHAICFRALSQSTLYPEDRTIIAMLDKLINDLKPINNSGMYESGGYEARIFDPYDVFYYTCYYLVLQRLDSTEIDRATALSSAFKRLQKRASRIEDAEIRRHYLTANYWNGLLSSAAKLHNLI